MKRKIAYSLLLVMLVFILFFVYKAFKLTSKQIHTESVTPIDIDSVSLIRFTDALKIKTISPENVADFDSSEFIKFSTYISTAYPLIDSLLEKKVFNSFTYLYKWKGADPLLKPVIIMAHSDVVPVNENTLKSWVHPPFNAETENDTIWARGTIDDKIGVIGIMESVEMLLYEGYQPQRTVYLAFGHDEEVGGELGAAAIARFLEFEKIEAEFILDEGGSIVQGMVPGIEKDVALIGVAEKGFVSLSLTVNIEGGHSSMPKSETAIGVLTDAILKLNSNPFPASITAPLQGFIDYLGPEMPFLNKLVFANSSIFSPVIINLYEGSAAGNALVRTTSVPTIFKSGSKDNVIPQVAEMTINLRILPGSSIQEVIERVRKIIDDERVLISKGLFASEPAVSSETETFGYKMIDKTIHELFPDVLTAPNLVIGATDSRHFSKISKNIYRFSPIYINENNIQSFHGVNERIAVKDFKLAVGFYYQMLKNSTGNN